MVADAWSLIELIIDLVDSFLILMLLTSSLKLKYDSRLMWLVYSVSLALLCAGANSMCTSMVQLLIVLCIILLLFTSFLTVGDFRTKVLWTLLTPIVFFGVDMLYTSIIIKLMSGLPPESIYQPSPLRFFNMIVSRLLIASIVMLILKRKIIVSASLPLASLLITCLILSFVSLLLLASLFARGHVFDNYMVISLLLLCAVNALYIYLFFSLKYRDERINEDTLIIQKLEYDHLKYTNTNTYVEYLTEWKHDMRKHLQALLAIFQSTFSDKNELFTSYLSKIEKGLDVPQPLVDTGNPLFDNIISSNCTHAVDSNIDVTLEMIVPPLTFIDPVDLCSILGNIWDNAIEGCAKAFDSGEDSVSIVFKTFVNANHFIMELTNTSVTDPASDLETSKTSPGHGIGIKSIKKLLDKNRGVYDFEALEGRFVARVAIPAKLESSDPMDHCVVINWRSAK